MQNEIHRSPLLPVLGTQFDSPIADEMSWEIFDTMSHCDL
jgi:hypothetical protein